MTKTASFPSKPFKNIDKYEKKNPVYYFQISLHFRDIQAFEICKLAQSWRHTLNQILIKYDEKDISANLYR